MSRRRLPHGQEVTIHRNSGLRKRCSCPRKYWAKCPHPWHFNFRWKGRHYRLSLNREAGQAITSKTEAEGWRDGLRAQIKEGTFRLAPAAPPIGPVPESQSETPGGEPETLKTYARAWLRTAALNLKASSVHFYTDHLENHIFPLLESRPITTITRADCRQLIATGREKGLKIGTVRGIVRTLSTVLSQAVEDELLPANPALRPGRYLRQGDEPQPQIDPFTRDEATHIVAVAREHFPQWYPWLLCALRTGLRHGELLALQWGDIDWRKGFVEVQRNLVRGKLTTPKNHQRRRVDMSRQLRIILRLWLRQKRAEWLKHGLPRPEWVFPSSAGTALDESNVRKAFKQLLEMAELRHRRVHDLRHTFASLLIQQGESLAYVKEQMGHASIQITVDTYGHLVPGGNRAAVDRLDDLPEAPSLRPTPSKSSSSEPIPTESVAQTLHKASQPALRRSA